MTPLPDNTDWYRVQKTLRDVVEFDGVGLHTGRATSIRIEPAPANHGLVFCRTDIAEPVTIQAHFEFVVATQLATTLGIAGCPHTYISTVEHVLSALYGTGVTNALISVNGPEVPILDGSALPFATAFDRVGFDIQPYSTRILKILKPIKVYEKDVICELLPREDLRLTTSVDFPHPSIGLQIYALGLLPSEYRKEIVGARTFGFLKDVERLKAAEFALGASLENVLAFSGSGVVNPEGMRFGDECVRHKMLDAIGDLALCGAWLEAEMVSFRGGHYMHLELLKALHQNPTHWKIQPAEPLPTEADRQAFVESRSRDPVYSASY